MMMLVRNKLLLLFISTALLIALMAGISVLFGIAQLPYEVSTSRHSYLLVMATHFASLLVFVRMKQRSIRHANQQIFWVFITFTFSALVILLATRLDYSLIVLGLGLPLSLALLLRHQHDLAKEDETALFILEDDVLAEKLGKLDIAFEVITADALQNDHRKGLLLISERTAIHDHYRHMLGFGAPPHKKLIIAEDFIENYNGYITHLTLSDMAISAKVTQFYRPIRRLVEIIISLVLLLLTSPIIIATFILIKLVSPGPVIFAQERVGVDGKLFTIFKFRTMHLESEALGQQFASADDPRIIKYGHGLRKSRIDELPQLWNVLRGDMSLIGPRPEQRDLFLSLCDEIEHFPLRQLVRPGITGWAQVVQGYADDTQSSEIKLSYDLYFIKHFGPTIDLLIIMRTLTTILTGFGSR